MCQDSNSKGKINFRYLNYYCVKPLRFPPANIIPLKGDCQHAIQFCSCPPSDKKGTTQLLHHGTTAKNSSRLISKAK